MTSTSRVAVVTGAAQGIGRRVAEVLADRGYALALTDLRDSDETVAAVRKRGREVLDVRGDVSVEAHVAAFAEQVRERFGQVDDSKARRELGYVGRVNRADALRSLTSTPWAR